MKIILKNKLNHTNKYKNSIGNDLERFTHGIMSNISYAPAQHASTKDHYIECVKEK